MDDKLLAILNKSKQIMNHDAVASKSTKGKGRYTSGNSDINIDYYNDDYIESNSRALSESTETPILNSGQSGSSKLPKEILDSMTSMKIPTVNEVLDLNNPFEIAARKMMESNNSNQSVKNTQNNSDYILVSKTELKNMMLETMLEIIPKITNTIEESAIKKTIQVIIKENKEKKGRL